MKSKESLDFTVIRKYSQQFITNADRQGANGSRELITFKVVGSLLFCLCLLRNRTPFLEVEV